MSPFLFVQNLDTRLEKPPRVRICDTFGCRLRGLMFSAPLPADQGLLLVMSGSSRLDASIHMLFVPFDLAVFWIDTRLEVVDKVIARSWRPAYVPVRPARYVLEIHPALFSAYEVGQKVSFIDA